MDYLVIDHSPTLAVLFVCVCHEVCQSGVTGVLGRCHMVVANQQCVAVLCYFLN